MFVDIMRRKIFMLSVTIYLFLFSCIHFKEHPLDPTTLRGYFLSSFLRNNSIEQDNNSIYQDNKSIYQEAKGILDDSFGNGRGYVTLNITNDNDQGQSLVIQPDGKILFGGYCQGVSNNDFCIARFNFDGTLDTSFDTDGKVIQDIASYSDLGQSLAIQPDGKILLSGRCYSGSNTDFCIARFNSNGTLDTTFGSPNGYKIQPIGSSNDYGYSSAIQPDGKILFGGHCKNGSYWDFCIARFNSNGTLDTTFGSPNGYIIQDIGSSDDIGLSLAIQPDGKILLGGRCQGVSNNDFCIARFNSDGTLDTSFGSPNGYIIQPIGSSDDIGQSLAIQPDGKILLGGYCYNGNNYDFCIARFNSDGTLDTSFGTNGKVIQDIGSLTDIGKPLVIQRDGKILLGGYCQGESNFDFCIARFEINGTLDTSFGTSGRVIQPIGSFDDHKQSLAILPDGKILLGGHCESVSSWDLCIARFNSDGTLDTSFGSSGKVIQPIGSSNDYGFSLAIQPDGKILLGGSCQGVSNFDFCIARFK